MTTDTGADRLILGRYRLLERLATGASADVWRARDEQLDRWVAVKLLHPHLLPDERSRDRFADEARAAGSLRHPSIVTVYDVDLDGETPAIVMELIEGESLAERLRRGPLPELQAADIGADLADALYHAHTRGIVHRDVKPGNILLDERGHAHLVDFGIARSLAESAERLTMTGTVIGTLRYMAPEQLRGEAIGPKTDLYALGVVLFEMLAGHVPFEAASPVALAEAQRAGAPPLPGVTDRIAATVLALLAPDPADRPLHAAAVAEALRDDETRTGPIVVPAAPPSIAAPVAQARRRNAIGWLAALAAAVLIAAVILAVVLGVGNPQPAAAPAASGPTATEPAATESPVQTEQPPAKADNPGHGGEKPGKGKGRGKGKGGG